MLKMMTHKMETPNNNFTRHTRSPHQAAKIGHTTPTQNQKALTRVYRDHVPPQLKNTLKTYDTSYVDLRKPTEASRQTLAFKSPSCIREKDKKNRWRVSETQAPRLTLLSTTKPLDGMRLDSKVVSVVMNDHNGRDEKKQVARAPARISHQLGVAVEFSKRRR